MTTERSAANPPAARGRFLLFAGLSVLTLGIGGWLTSLGMDAWYDALAKPPFQPPGWVFSPVWTTIFILITISTWQLDRREAWKGSVRALYFTQLVLNVGWSLCFFAMKNPALALAEIVVLDAVVVAMMLVYGRAWRPAGLMILPYVIWLGLATSINAWIVLYA
jgi:translocator protein